jgi:hypothetical protein
MPRPPDDDRATYTMFDGQRRAAGGALDRVVRKAKTAFDRGATVLIFNDGTGEVVDLDYRGTARDVLARLAAAVPATRPNAEGTPPEAPRGRGRPKLGVVAREVTLLPRHWAWLGGQPGGASVALRRLVDDARRANAGRDRVRRAQEITYRVMTALAGDLPGFEEAIRALFAANRDGFDHQIAAWPHDVQRYVSSLAQEAFHGSH